MKISKVLALVSLVAAAFLAGCGGDAKMSETQAPAGQGPAGGNNPSAIPPPAGMAPSGGGNGPQGTIPPPAGN